MVLAALAFLCQMTSGASTDALQWGSDMRWSEGYFTCVVTNIPINEGRFILHVYQMGDEGQPVKILFQEVLTNSPSSHTVRFPTSAFDGDTMIIRAAVLYSDGTERVTSPEWDLRKTWTKIKLILVGGTCVVIAMVVACCITCIKCRKKN